MVSEEIQPKENKMGVMPIGKLLISMSVPMMISMLVQALYNVVDSYFVAQLSQDALNAVSLSFPVQNLMISIAVGTGVGVNALLSRNLGERDFEGASRAAGNGIVLALLSSMVMVLLGLAVPRAFFSVQTDIPGIVEQGTEYLTIVSVVPFGCFLGVMFERLLQSTGKTVYAMIAQGVGAITNIVLDPLLIFGVGPFPRMGVAGAAAATVAGQILGAVVSGALNVRRNREISFELRYLRPNSRVIGQIYAVGVPSMIMGSIGSVMVFGLNQILMAFTDTATAVFGIYFKLQSFVFMPVFGLNNGMVPVIAYNYGARQPERIVETRRKATWIAIALMLCGLAAAELLPERLLGLFNASEEMLEIGVPALRIICISFLFAGYGIVSVSTFQALGHGVMSMVGSIVRQLVVLLPAAWLLSLTGRLELVWLAFPAAEITATILCVFFNRRIDRTVIQPMREGWKAA